MRILSLGLMLLSVAALGVAILTIRRESRIKNRLDVLRLVVSVGTIVVVVSVLGRNLNLAFAAVGGVAGLGLGWFQGQQLQIRVAHERAYVKRTATGIALWAVGVVLIQLAGVMNRTGLLDVGAAISVFGIGMAASLLFSRRLKLSAYLGSLPVATSVAAGLLLVLLAAIASSTFAPTRPAAAIHDDVVAQDEDLPIACPLTVGSLDLWGTRNANRGIRCVYNITLPAPDGFHKTDSDAGFITLTGELEVNPLANRGRCESRTELEVDVTTSAGEPELLIRSAEFDAWVKARSLAGYAADQTIAIGAARAWLAEFAPNADPCLPGDGETFSAGGFSCPGVVGNMVLFRWVYGNEIEPPFVASDGRTSFQCRYTAAFRDEDPLDAVARVTYFTENKEFLNVCNPRDETTPADDGGTQHVIYRVGGKNISIRAASTADLAPFEALAAEFGAAAAPLAASCEAIDDGAAAVVPPIASDDDAGDESAASGGGDADDTSAADTATDGTSTDETDAASGSEESDNADDEIAPEDALAAAGIVLSGAALLAATTLLESGRTITEILEAFQRGGARGIREIGLMRPTTITLTGEAAERAAALQSGEDLEIPERDRWGIYIDGGQGDDYLGSRGRIRGTGTWIEGPDGEKILIIDVDAYDPEAMAAFEADETTIVPPHIDLTAADTGPDPLFDAWGNELHQGPDGRLEWVEQADDGTFSTRWIDRDEARRLSGDSADFWRQAETARVGAQSWEDAFQRQSEEMFAEAAAERAVEERIASGELTRQQAIDQYGERFPSLAEDLARLEQDRLVMRAFDERAAVAERWLEENAPGHLRQLDRLREQAAARGAVDLEQLIAMHELSRRAIQQGQNLAGIDKIDYEKLAEGAQFTEDVTWAVMQGLGSAIDPTGGWLAGGAVGVGQGASHGKEGVELAAYAAANAAFNRLGIRLGGMGGTSIAAQTLAQAGANYAEGYVMSGGSHEGGINNAFLGSVMGTAMHGAGALGKVDAPRVRLPDLEVTFGAGRSPRVAVTLPDAPAPRAAAGSGLGDSGSAPRLTDADAPSSATRPPQAPEPATRPTTGDTPDTPGGTRMTTGDTPDTPGGTRAGGAGADSTPVRPRENVIEPLRSDEYLPDSRTPTPRQAALSDLAADTGVKDPFGNRAGALFADADGRILDHNGTHILNVDPETGRITDLRGVEIDEIAPSLEGGYGEMYGPPRGYTVEGKKVSVTAPSDGQAGRTVVAEPSPIAGRDPVYRDAPEFDVDNRTFRSPEVDSTLAQGTGADPAGRVTGQDGEVFGQIEGNKIMTTDGSGREITGYGGVIDGKPSWYRTADGELHWTGEMSNLDKQRALTGGRTTPGTPDAELAALVGHSEPTNTPIAASSADGPLPRAQLEGTQPTLQSGMDLASMDAATQRSQWNQMVEDGGLDLPRFEI